jgi:hypothetical protein
VSGQGEPEGEQEDCQTDVPHPLPSVLLVEVPPQLEPD